MATCGGVSNHIQVCYDIIGRDTGGFTVRFYVNTVGWGWNDDQTLSVSGSNGTSGSWNYHASASSGQSKTMFQVDVGFPAPPGGCVNFSASVSGIAGGGSPSVGGTDCAYAAAPCAPNVGVDSVTQTSAHGFSSNVCENGSSIDTINYRVHRVSDGAHMGDLQGGWGGVTFTNLAPGNGYDMYAQAHNGAGWSGWGGPVRFYTSAGVPNPPGVAVDTITATSAHVWASSAGAENGATAQYLEYRVNRVSDGGVAGTGGGPGTGYAGVVIGGLVRATQYIAYARTYNAVGWSAWSAGVRFDTLPSIPGAPTITSITGITPTSAVVSWAPPSDTGGQTVTAYDVEYSPDPTFATGAVTQPTGTLNGLTPGVTYYVHVRAKNASGAGPWSSTSSTSTFTTQTGMKVYNGTTWVDSPVYAWNGSTWVACEVRIYNGTAWVPTG